MKIRKLSAHSLRSLPGSAPSLLEKEEEEQEQEEEASYAHMDQCYFFDVPQEARETA